MIISRGPDLGQWDKLIISVNVYDNKILKNPYKPNKNIK